MGACLSARKCHTVRAAMRARRAAQQKPCQGTFVALSSDQPCPCMFAAGILSPNCGEARQRAGAKRPLQNGATYNRERSNQSCTTCAYQKGALHAALHTGARVVGSGSSVLAGKVATLVFEAFVISLKAHQRACKVEAEVAMSPLLALPPAPPPGRLPRFPGTLCIIVLLFAVFPTHITILQAFSLEPRVRGSSGSSDSGDAGEDASVAGLGGTLFPPRSQEEWQRQVALALQAKQVGLIGRAAGRALEAVQPVQSSQGQ